MRSYTYVDVNPPKEKHMEKNVGGTEKSKSDPVGRDSSCWVRIRVEQGNNSVPNTDQTQN